MIFWVSVKEDDISIAFSGNKGFHVFVNHRVFGYEPHAYQPQIFKNMARELVQKHRLKTLDLAIYDRRRLIRLPNSRHPKSNLYKIPLTLSELQKLTVNEIKLQAMNPRIPWFPPRKHEVSEKARRWYLGHRDNYMKTLEERRVEFSDVDFETKSILPCVKKRLGGLIIGTIPGIVAVFLAFGWARATE